MERIEITPSSIDRFDDIAEGMARGYQIAFAFKDKNGGWGEASKCINDTCSTGFCGKPAGNMCTDCGEVLVEAYEIDELVANWRNMLLNEDAFMEVMLNQNGEAVSTTIARPTNRDELIQRKYTGDEMMAEWVGSNLPQNFTWIEDTFANRELRLRGNLAQRGKTLARIALRYSGDDIATRTIEPRIIGATARDVGRYTDMYRGTKDLKLNANSIMQLRSIGSVPDWRTLLKIDGRGIL